VKRAVRAARRIEREDEKITAEAKKVAKAEKRPAKDLRVDAKGNQSWEEAREGERRGREESRQEWMRLKGGRVCPPRNNKPSCKLLMTIAPFFESRPAWTGLLTAPTRRCAKGTASIANSTSTGNG
jgi:hypothetical protein